MPRESTRSVYCKSRYFALVSFLAKRHTLTTHFFVSFNQSTLQTHRIEKERVLAEQEKKGQPRHVAQIRRARTSLPEQESLSDEVSNSAAHPTSLASICPPSGGSNINIICRWSAVVGNGQDDTIQGQHHLRNLLVRPLNKSKGCPIALTAKYNSRVVHNFDEGPLVSSIVLLA